MPDYPPQRLLERLKVAGGRHSSEEDKNDGRVVGKCWAPREKLHLIEVTHPQKCFGLNILMMQDKPLQTMMGLLCSGLPFHIFTTMELLSGKNNNNEYIMFG